MYIGTSQRPFTVRPKQLNGSQRSTHRPGLWWALVKGKNFDDIKTVIEAMPISLGPRQQTPDVINVIKSHSSELITKIIIGMEGKGTIEAGCFLAGKGAARCSGLNASNGEGHSVASTLLAERSQGVALQPGSMVAQCLLLHGGPCLLRSWEHYQPSRTWASPNIGS